mmetsp:Transcript_2005/g.5609  ORF Transcript_2005/g.5609 Transcript_2005/m.5609 type:complete len:198 (+) Transcript_2005:63-656(+)
MHLPQMNGTTACVATNLILGVLIGVVASHVLPCAYIESKKKRTIAKGDVLPDATLYDGSPDMPVQLKQVCQGKRVVIVGVPGAFTPTCHKTHLPAFVKDAKALAAKGVQAVICVSVNDPFVMAAWGQALGDGVHYLADTQGQLASELGLVLDATPKLGNKRMRRFALVAEDNVVTVIKTEEGGALTCSRSEDILKSL